MCHLASGTTITIQHLVLGRPCDINSIKSGEIFVTT